MDTPNRLIELRTADDNEHAKLRGLDGDEHAVQWKRWHDAAVECQAARHPDG
ncbi:hypothetical protein [Streptomyces sp. S465]|uniref:hypothetical protein n=1 Tax=Streptomyces sp. S465 TaxID=2979468 RepID=UPI0022A85CA1|nr:hypothetical protein [Streptomyces sp. S465]WAP57813.1 hypothetical protein N6H00_24205 [Streptomyces sp. S465]